MKRDNMYSLFYEKYFDRSVSTSYKYVKDADIAKDIVCKGLEKSLDFEFENERHLYSWITSLVINESLNYYNQEVNRKITRRQLAYCRGKFDSENPETVLVEKMRNLVLKNLIDAYCPPQSALIIKLLYYEGYSIPQVAQMLNISRSAVKTQKYAGLAKLRKRFNVTKEQADANNLHLLNKIKSSEKSKSNIAKLYGFKVETIWLIITNNTTKRAYL